MEPSFPSFAAPRIMVSVLASGNEFGLVAGIPGHSRNAAHCADVCSGLANRSDIVRRKADYGAPSRHLDQCLVCISLILLRAHMK